MADTRPSTASAALPPAVVALLPPSLQALCTGLQLARGQVLFRTGQRPRAMHYLLEGELVLQRIAAAGDVVVLRRVREGFVAEASLQVAAYHCDAVAASPARLLRVPMADVADALRHDSAFALRWIAMLSGEVRRLRSQCERLALNGVAARLMHLFDTEAPAGRLPVKGGLKSLASEIGVSHEALYRTLARLERDGRLRREPGLLVRMTPSE